MFTKCLFIILILLFVSCTEDSKYKIENNRLVIYPNQLKVDDVEDVPWLVGRFRKKKFVSKGMRVKLLLPTFSEELSRELFKRGVDSLLVRVRRLKGASKINMGYIYISFIKKHKDSNWGKTGKIDYIFLQINYAAASMSKRFERFPCPAFNHRLKIDDWGLEKLYGGEKYFVISRKGSPLGKPKQQILEPQIFNGEMSLKGRYSFALAFYNSKSNIIYSDFATFDNELSINSEEIVALEGCSNFGVPDREKYKKDAKRFRWSK